MSPEQGPEHIGSILARVMRELFERNFPAPAEEPPPESGVRPMRDIESPEDE